MADYTAPAFAGLTKTYRDVGDGSLAEVVAAAGITTNPTATFTRPADTTAYASGDLVANSTTAGSVVAMTLTVGRVAGGSCMLRRCKLATSSTSTTSASFRLHLFRTAPATVTNGDNGAFSVSGVADYIGAFDITVDRAFTDGAAGVGATVNWALSHRADPRALPLADRHYSRQKPGSPQFVPPGRCLVLLTEDADALWVTSWPFAEYVKHRWAGAWVCSFFRNEGPTLSSALITEAVAATRWFWPDVPPLGMVTFINTAEVRRKRDWGRCYRKAGWRPVGHTQGGLVALQLEPAAMPEPMMPNGGQHRL